MKANYTTISILAMGMVILLGALAPCEAVATGKNKENNWLEDKPKGKIKWLELTDEGIERMMSRLEKTDPEKAKELAQLREKEPEKFKAELRKVMREKVGKRFGQHRDRRELRDRQRSRHRGPDAPAGHGGIRGRGGRMGRGGMMGMREKHTEYLEWLEKNYPEEAKKLAELREKKPKLHTRRLGLGHKKYRRIMEAERECPGLAKALKEDLELKRKRDKLLRKISSAGDEAEKKQLTEELKEVVGSRFDLIVKRRQIRYKKMLEKLGKLQEEVKRSEANIDKWKDVEFKNENVQARVNELVGGAEKFKWE